jgi:VCBS repeat-containing protein
LADHFTDFLDQNQTLTLVYQLTDSSGQKQVTIILTGTNDTPVAIADSNAGDAVKEAGVKNGNTAEAGDPNAVGNVLTNDTDVDQNHVLSVAAVGGFASNVGQAVTGTYGTLTLNADGSYSYVLNNDDPDTQALKQDEAAQDIFQYTVTDEHGATSTANLTINIGGTNDAPTVTHLLSDQNATETVPFEFQFAANTFSDVDKDALLTYSASLSDGTQLPSWLQFDAATRTFSGTPSINDGGSIDVKVLATDEFGASTFDIFKIQIAEGDVDGPDGVHFSLATGDHTASSNSGNLKAGDIVGSFVAFGDTDPDTYTYSLGNPSSSNFVLSSTGILSVATNTNGGTYEVSIIAEDSFGHASPATPYTIWVGDNSNNGSTAPSFANNPNSVIAFGVNGGETIIGSAFDDALSGAKGNDVLVGGAGNDYLVGGADADTFKFAAGFGHDTVADFHSGEDVIEIASSVFANFNDLVAHSVSNQTETVITVDDSNSITLKNVTSLQSADFHFV